MQMIHMKCQDLFSMKNKKKSEECCDKCYVENSGLV